MVRFPLSMFSSPSRFRLSLALSSPLSRQSSLSPAPPLQTPLPLQQPQQGEPKVVAPAGLGNALIGPGCGGPGTWIAAERKKSGPGSPLVGRDWACSGIPGICGGGARARSAQIARASAGSAVVEPMDATQQRLMFEDQCILVDENDRVIGHDTKYNCHLMERIEKDKGGMLHRAFSVFLFDSQNRLLLQQRAGSKVTFPLVWTNTCCSHPLFRDDELEEADHTGVKVAARRKLGDELGIPPEQVALDDIKVIGRIHYKAPSDGQWGEHELDYLLFLQGEVSVTPNPNEVAAVQYVDPEGLRELVRQAEAGEGGVKLSPWFKLVVDNFLFSWWDHLKAGTLDSVKDMTTIHRLL